MSFLTPSSLSTEQVKAYQSSIIWEFTKLVPLFWVPYNKEYSSFGSTWGVPLFGEIECLAVLTWVSSGAVSCQWVLPGQIRAFGAQYRTWQSRIIRGAPTSKPQNTISNISEYTPTDYRSYSGDSHAMAPHCCKTPTLALEGWGLRICRTPKSLRPET